MFSQKFKISNITISNNHKALTIAEIGINHEGSKDRCIKLIEKASTSGADLIKLQIIDPDSSYEKKTLSYKLFKKSNLTKEEIFNIYKFAQEKGIKIFSTLDKKNFQILKKIKQPCYKISSSLFYDFYLIKDILKKNKPVFISTGVSDVDDIETLLKILKKEKNKKIVILHARSLYPTNISKLNLSRISYIKSKFGVIPGFSDHSLGDDAVLASLHYGAKVIEKHFTLDNKRPNYDHHISLNPKEFKNMVGEIRKNEEMIGNFDFKVFKHSPDLKKIKKVIRSYKLIKSVNKNTVLKKTDFKLIRTNSTKNIVKFSEIVPKILKKKTSKKIKSGAFLKPSSFKD